MTCQTCGGAFVRLGHRETTLMGSGGPPGHDHDRNCVGRSAWCAAGHRTLLMIRRRCNDHECELAFGHATDDSGQPWDTTPACDWLGKATCTICAPHVLVDAWPDVPEAP